VDSASASFRDLLQIVGSGRRSARNLTRDEAERAFTSLLSGEATDVQAGAFLTAMRWKGETAEELAGFARAARALARLPATEAEGVVCLGIPQEGHDRTPPLEASAAIVAAACDVRVFFVSDRSHSPDGGWTAADALEGLGGGFTDDAAHAADLLGRPGLAALSTNACLPGLRKLDRVRAELETRNSLHTVEKLLHLPGRPVLVGAAGGPVLAIAADVVRALGHERAVVVQGPDGSVVPSLVGPTRGIEVDGASLSHLAIDPSDYGFRRPKEPRLAQPGPDGVAAAIRGVLLREAGAARNASVLGAALILYTAGVVGSLSEGVGRAAAAIDEGKALAVLDELRTR
jgi:anthranilate phosphoribosyltransferase